MLSFSVRQGMVAKHSSVLLPACLACLHMQGCSYYSKSLHVSCSASEWCDTSHCKNVYQEGCVYCVLYCCFCGHYWNSRWEESASLHTLQIVFFFEANRTPNGDLNADGQTSLTTVWWCLLDKPAMSNVYKMCSVARAANLQNYYNEKSQFVEKFRMQKLSALQYITFTFCSSQCWTTSLTNSLWARA